jgi:hypothetical protein
VAFVGEVTSAAISIRSLLLLLLLLRLLSHLGL